MSLLGKPKLIFETPRINFSPCDSYSSFRREIVLHVSNASFCCELTVKVRASITISLGFIPYFCASFIIFFATLILPSAVGAIPSSSKHKATIVPP